MYVSDKQEFVVDDDEIAGYMLHPDEQEKRSAIFEKTFRQVLDERINRKLNGGKTKSRKNAAALLSSHEKKSSKINYDALRVMMHPNYIHFCSDIKLI